MINIHIYHFFLPLLVYLKTVQVFDQPAAMNQYNSEIQSRLFELLFSNEFIIIDKFLSPFFFLVIYRVIISFVKSLNYVIKVFYSKRTIKK